MHFDHRPSWCVRLRALLAEWDPGRFSAFPTNPQVEQLLSETKFELTLLRKNLLDLYGF